MLKLPSQALAGGFDFIQCSVQLFIMLNSLMARDCITKTTGIKLLAGGVGIAKRFD